MIFYKHFIGDYQRDTGHLSILEHGAYRLLMDACYATEKPLPADERRIFRLLRATEPDEHEAIRTVLAEFWELGPDGWVNKRAASEIEKAQERAATNRRIAEEREAKRKHAVEEDDGSTQRETKRATTGTTNREPSQSQTPEPESESQSEPETDSGAGPPPAKAGGPRKGWPGMDTKTGPTWHAYADAYAGRYGTDPVWNGSVAGGIRQFIRRVGAEDAPAIAAFYVGHNSRWYVEKGHSVLCMLNDAEKLRTEWLTGKSMTGTRARQIERTATNFDNARAADELLAKRKRGNLA